MVTVYGTSIATTNLLCELDAMGIKCDSVPLPPREKLKKLVTKIRAHRDVIGTKKKGNWKFEDLIKSPILDIEGDLTYPEFYLTGQTKLERLCFMNMIKDKQHADEQDTKNTIKLKIKIPKHARKHTQIENVNLSLESLARINVTMLRLINGIDIYVIMKGWTEEEKAAGMIMWRLAQHNKRNDLRLIAEMMNNKADQADPYAEKIKK
jgi:hypothetical protein